MAEYAKIGLVERVEEGVFRLTEAGFLKVGLKAEDVVALVPPAPAPAPDQSVAALDPAAFSPEARDILGYEPSEPVSDAA